MATLVTLHPFHGVQFGSANGAVGSFTDIQLLQHTYVYVTKMRNVTDTVYHIQEKHVLLG